MPAAQSAVQLAPASQFIVQPPCPPHVILHVDPALHSIAQPPPRQLKAQSAPGSHVCEQLIAVTWQVALHVLCDRQTMAQPVTVQLCWQSSPDLHSQGPLVHPTTRVGPASGTLPDEEPLPPEDDVLDDVEEEEDVVSSSSLQPQRTATQKTERRERRSASRTMGTRITNVLRSRA